MKVSEIHDILRYLPLPAHIHIGADASLGSSVISGAYATTRGHFGIIGHTPESNPWRPANNSAAVELWAACQGILRTIKSLQNGPRPITIYTDNNGAYAWLDRWIKGSTTIPPWDSDGYFRFACNSINGWRTVAEMKVVHVPRKTFPLQHLCHRLAELNLPLVQGKLTKEKIKARARRWVDAELKSINAQLP